MGLCPSKKYFFLQMRWIRLKMLLGGGGIPDLSIFFLHSRRTAPGWLVVIFDVMKQNEFLQAESRFSMQSQEFQVHWVKCSFIVINVLSSSFLASSLHASQISRFLHKIEPLWPGGNVQNILLLKF
jgi:hypothetical protein